MKHLKYINELKADTYKSAANSLHRLGHTDRAKKLADYGMTMDHREKKDFSIKHSLCEIPFHFRFDLIDSYDPNNCTNNTEFYLHDFKVSSAYNEINDYVMVRITPVYEYLKPVVDGTEAMLYVGHYITYNFNTKTNELSPSISFVPKLVSRKEANVFISKVKYLVEDGFLFKELRTSLKPYEEHDVDYFTIIELIRNHIKNLSPNLIYNSNPIRSDAEKYKVVDDIRRRENEKKRKEEEARMSYKLKRRLM